MKSRWFPRRAGEAGAHHIMPTTLSKRLFALAKVLAAIVIVLELLDPVGMLTPALALLGIEGDIPNFQYFAHEHSLYKSATTWGHIWLRRPIHQQSRIA